MTFFDLQGATDRFQPEDWVLPWPAQSLCQGAKIFWQYFADLLSKISLDILTLTFPWNGILLMSLFANVFGPLTTYIWMSATTPSSGNEIPSQVLQQGAGICWGSEGAWGPGSFFRTSQFYQNLLFHNLTILSKFLIFPDPILCRTLSWPRRWLKKTTTHIRNNHIWIPTNYDISL